MNSIADDLPLRDIHLPESVLWWPLAPGWWILIGFLLFSIALIIYLVRRYQKNKHSAYTLASTSLEQISHQYKDDKQRFIQELSKLLRQTVLQVYPRQDVASLTNEDWLRLLDTDMEDKPFSEGVGRILVEAPYKKSITYDPQQLIELCRQWLQISIKKNEAKA